MDVALLIARLVMAALFIVSAATKVFDLGGTRTMVSAFGVPARVVAAVSVALPTAELTTAVLLLVPATDWWGGLVSLVLLAAFTAAIAANLGQGRTPECRCFGSIGAKPIDRSSILRNAVFAAPALFLVLAA